MVVNQTAFPLQEWNSFFQLRVKVVCFFQMNCLYQTTYYYYYYLGRVNEESEENARQIVRAASALLSCHVDRLFLPVICLVSYLVMCDSFAINYRDMILTSNCAGMDCPSKLYSTHCCSTKSRNQY